MSFSGSRIVWQFYAGEGLQIQWLGTFGKANGLWQGGYDTSLRALLDEALALAAAARRRDRLGVPLPLRRRPAAVGQRPGAGHRRCRRSRAPPCASASRATSRPRAPALGIFREAPPSGVRVATPAGAHYLIYSFAPGLRVLNAFTQALNGLHDFAVLANDAEGRALFAAGEAQLRGELAAVRHRRLVALRARRPRRRRELPHARARLPAQPLRAPDRGRGARGPPPDRARHAGGGARHRAPVRAGAAAGARRSIRRPTAPPPSAGRSTSPSPPVVKLVSRRARGGKPAVLKLSVSKPSNVTLRVRRGGRTVVVLGGNLGSGVRSLRWPRPPRSAASYKVLAARAGPHRPQRRRGEATLKLLRRAARER